MWIPLLSVTLLWVPTTNAAELCNNVFGNCQQSDVPWTRCYEDSIRSCKQKGRSANFYHGRVNSSKEAEIAPTPHHRVHIPSSALRRSAGGAEEEVLLVATVIDSKFFKPPPPKKTRLITIPEQTAQKQGSVLGGLVLVVAAGNRAVSELPHPITLTFKYNQQVENGTCVFWQESKVNNGTGYWSTSGCNTSDSGAEFFCRCNHMSFFAVLVNPVLTVDKVNAVTLSYITYVGSALSIVFTLVSLIIYTCLQRRRPDKAIAVHLQLTAALFGLHLSFLLCSVGAWGLTEAGDGWICRGLGFVLHWSLLATLSWTALEGFHLYLLLVRVFNIYVRRYLLKLSLVGWGFPTLVAVVCGIFGVYGKLEVTDPNNQNSVAHICWMSSRFPHRLVVSYVTVVGLLGLVVLCNSCMMALVVLKVWRIKAAHRGVEGGERWRRLWKDGVTVLGLSCVLGLSWGLASTTYVSVAGIYAFTVLNSMQGVFMFLWAVALSCKSRSDHNSSVKEPSSQKVMTTSF